jgi:hypothetical protein
MADYTTDSPATLVCAAKYAPVLATVTNVRQENGITFLDVSYVAQTAETCTTTLRIAELATDAEIESDIDAYGAQWYKALRAQLADAGAWAAGLTALIGSNYAPWFPPSP